MKVSCPHCNQEYELSSEYMHKECECSVCHKKFIPNFPAENKNQIRENLNEHNNSLHITIKGIQIPFFDLIAIFCLFWLIPFLYGIVFFLILNILIKNI